MKLTLLISLLAFACQHQPSQQSLSPSAEDTLKNKWSVSGCADPSRPGGKSKFDPSLAADPDLPLAGVSAIRAGGDSVGYERFVRHGCCRQARISSTVSGGVITFTEYWWGQICKCMCQSTLQARVGGLAPGTYQVFVVETGTDIITDQPDPARDTVLIKTVEIR